MKFSDVKGENVVLTREKNSVSWKDRYSGGIVFSEFPLVCGKQLKLTVRGTSIIHVGFFNQNPDSVANLKELHLKKSIDFIAELNVYKKKCSVYLERSDSSFTYIRGDIPYTVNIPPDMNIWAAVYIQFGDASVRLYSETELMTPVPFHATHGQNIEFFDNSRTAAKLHIPNPSATACIELNPTEEKAVSVTLRLKPCSASIKKYRLSLLATHSSPKLLSTSSEYMFMTDAKIQQQQSKCTSIQSFVRKSGKFNTCDGKLIIKVENGGKVKYHHDSAGSGSAQITEQVSQSGGITLVLDMLGVTADIIDVAEHDARYESDDEECSSMSSVNSTSVISTCLHRQLNSPTATPLSIMKQPSEGAHNYCLEEKDESVAESPVASFKQPFISGNNILPKDKERLNDWVKETTKYTTPIFPTGDRFITGHNMPDNKTEEISKKVDVCFDRGRAETRMVLPENQRTFLPNKTKEVCKEVNPSIVENELASVALPGNQRTVSSTRVCFSLGDEVPFNQTEEENAAKTSESVRKRRATSPLAKPDVCTKRPRLHNPFASDDRQIESLVPSIGKTSTWGNEKIFSGTDLESSFGLRSRHREKEYIHKPNKDFDDTSSLETKESPYFQTQLMQGRMPIEKYKEEAKRISPTCGRLESKRSKIGIRVLPPTKAEICVQKSGVLANKHPVSTKTIKLKHQSTFPDISSAIDHSVLFSDDYQVTLRKNASSHHCLRENIRQNYTSLVKQLVAVPLVDHLYEAEILHEDEHGQFISGQQSSDTNRKLLATLGRKPIDRNKFESALRASSLEHLIPMFM